MPDLHELLTNQTKKCGLQRSTSTDITNMPAELQNVMEKTKGGCLNAL